MSKYCPIINAQVVYLDCLECIEKLCKKETNKENNTNYQNLTEDNAETKL